MFLEEGEKAVSSAQGQTPGESVILTEGKEQEEPGRGKEVRPQTDTTKGKKGSFLTGEEGGGGATPQRKKDK